MVTSGEAAWDDVPDFDDPDLVFGMPDDIITTRVDVRPWAERKLAAMQGHETQVGDLARSWPCRSSCSANRWAPSSSSAEGAAHHRDDDIFAGLTAADR
jgi:LmbE family N-acetylglucosaminyl deacetylase